MILVTGATGFIGSHLIKELKNLRKQLREKDTKNIADHFVKNAPLPYQSLDAYGNFIDVNSVWLKTLGYTRDEVIGKSFGNFLDDATMNGFRTNFPRFKKKGSTRNVYFEMIPIVFPIIIGPAIILGIFGTIFASKVMQKIHRKNVD